jgi:ELWxxDGT repeat protein
MCRRPAAPASAAHGVQPLEPRRLLSVTMLKDIAAGSNSSYPLQFYGSAIGTFFIAGSTSQKKLWKTDGTTNGTVLVKSLRSTGNVSQSDIAYQGSAFAELNGKVYFFGDDGTHGFELFATDGTDPGSCAAPPSATTSRSTAPRSPSVRTSRRR